VTTLVANPKLQDWSQGTVNVVLGQLTVSGTNLGLVSIDPTTGATLIACSRGDILCVGTTIAFIAAVTDANDLLLFAPWTGPTTSAQAYTITRLTSPANSSLAATLNTLMSLGTDANPYPSWTLDDGTARLKSKLLSGVPTLAVGPTNTADADLTAGLQIDPTTGAVTLGNGRTQVVDANYQALVTDRQISYTAVSAPRTVTLPAAALYPAGQVLVIDDESGSVSLSNSLSIVPGGSDTFQSQTGQTCILTGPNSYAEVVSNGSNAWAIHARSPNLRVFTSSGVYTPSAGMKFADVYAYGGGGGGGGGCLSAGSTNASGGGGGGGAAVNWGRFSAQQIGASQNVTVGAGGAGGVHATTSSTAGHNGVTGGATSMGSLHFAGGGGGGAGGQINGVGSGGGGGADCYASGGNASGATGGAAPTAGSTSSGGSAGPAQNVFYQTAGSGGGGCSAAGVPGIGGESIGGASGGGAGGGLTSGGVAKAGAAGGLCHSLSGLSAAAGGATNSNGANGASFSASTSAYNLQMGGGGGGGGAGETGTAGNGGQGGSSGGGGGGGGSNINGHTAGAGGAGGPGLMLIVEFF
jgi:hypothetical protein